MSNKLTALVGGMLLVVAFLAGTTQGCGGGDGGNNYADICNRGCDKFAMCYPEAAAFVTQCKSGCTSMGQGTTTCTNQTAIVNAAKACLDVPCAQLEACQDGIPDCVTGAGGSTGGGGSTGAAGTTGQGGTGGAPAAECATCTAAEACCQAIPSTGGQCGYSVADCNMLTGANQANYIAGCQAIFTVARLLPDPPPACL